MCESERCLRREKEEEEELRKKYEKLKLEMLNNDFQTETKIELLSLVKVLERCILKWDLEEARRMLETLRHKIVLSYS